MQYFQANVTITTQKEQLRHKDALLATAAENLNMERSRREKAEADVRLSDIH